MIPAALGFAVAAAYIPNIPGAAVTPRWALLSIAVPSTLYVLNPRISWRGILPLILLAWATLSLCWTTSLPDGLYVAAQLAILIGVGWIGAQVDDLRPVYFGAAIGMGISSLLIVLEVFGIDVLQQLSEARPGLFYNPNMVTEAAVLTFVACFATRQYWVSLLPLPALFLTHARGALVSLAVTAMWWAWKRSPWYALAVGIALFAGSLALVANNTGNAAEFRGGRLVNFASVTDRIEIWTDTLSQLTPLGTGIGSFRYEFPKSEYRHNTLVHGFTDHAHNDLLELTYELGIPGLILALLILGMALRGPYEAERLILLAFLVEGMFQFPLWMPVTGCLAALAMGRLMAVSGGFRRFPATLTVGRLMRA